MPVQRKIFRVEEMALVSAPAATLWGANISSSERDEILVELKALHTLLEPRVGAAAVEHDSAHQFKADVDAVKSALARIKLELASLHANAFGGPPARVTRELKAVVEGAESATQQILNAAEDIEDAAHTLSASLKHGQEQSLALDIRDNAMRIFEACNFQDLGGQRVAKVLSTLKFVEERITHMVEIFSDVDALKADSAAAAAERECSIPLHGPKLEGDEGHASQERVDAMFAHG